MVTEKTNQTTIDLLSKFCQEEPNRWDEFLPYIEYQINSAWQESIKVSPYQAVYGIPPPVISVDCGLDMSNPLVTLEDHLKYGFIQVREKIMNNLALSREKQKAQFNKH